MNLVWKLLRQHVSLPQFLGFFFANLFGMLIVLLGVQFYRDVLPVFVGGDTFMKSDYLIVSKHISTGTTLSGSSNVFTTDEIADLNSQRFARKVAWFTTADYRVDARMGINGQQVLSSEIFFESVPDDFVDVSLDEWQWTEGSRDVPIILPRTYLTMYNFGFARSRSLPKISEGLVGMIDFQLFIRGDQYKGRVIGFSSRLNTILVPQRFMEWTNSRYATGEASAPNRLVMEVSNPADDQITRYLDDRGYEVEDEKLNAEKTTYFLRMVVMLVMGIGLIISILSFYILMLSIYLLVQKNTSKLENLLLIGYSPSAVARPYQLLTLGLNLAVLLIAWTILYFIRAYYMDIIVTLFPDIDEGTMMPALLVGLVLFVLVTVVNQFAIHHKIMSIWNHKT